MRFAVIVVAIHVAIIAGQRFGTWTHPKNGHMCWSSVPR